MAKARAKSGAKAKKPTTRRRTTKAKPAKPRNQSHAGIVAAVGVPLGSAEVEEAAEHPHEPQHYQPQSPQSQQVHASHAQIADAAKYALAKRKLSQGILEEQVVGGKIDYCRLYVTSQWPDVILDDFQWDIFRCVFDPTLRQLFVKGNTGCGKGGSISMSVVAYFDVFVDARVILVSASFDHALDVGFREVKKWFKAAKYRPDGAVYAGQVNHNEGHYIVVVNPEVDEGFSGRHGDHTLFWFDEATSIVDERFPLAMTQAKKMIASANPRTMAGKFRDSFDASDPDTTKTIPCEYGLRRCVTVDGADCMNVRMKRLSQPISPEDGFEIEGRRYRKGETLDKAVYDRNCKPIIPGQTCLDKYLAIMSDPDPFVRDVFGKARFPRMDPDSLVISPDWLDRHARYWWDVLHQCGGDSTKLNEVFPVLAFGLDIASSKHGDDSVLVSGGEHGFRHIHTRKIYGTMKVVGWVIELVKDVYGIDLTSGSHPLAVDMDGLGMGAGERLSEQGVWVIEIRGNRVSEIDPSRYANKRTEMYAEFGERLNPDGKYGGRPFALPDDQQGQMMRHELVLPQKIGIGSDAFRFRISPKEDVKKKLQGRSPDRADATVYCWEALRQVCECNNIANQLDTSAFDVDTRWLDGLDGEWRP